MLSGRGDTPARLAGVSPVEGWGGGAFQEEGTQVQRPGGESTLTDHLA